MCLSTEALKLQQAHNYKSLKCDTYPHGMTVVCQPHSQRSPFFCYSIFAQYNTRKQKSSQKSWGRPANSSCDVTQGGSTLKIVCNKCVSKFLTSEVESSERLRSCLAMKSLMVESGTLFECGPLPSQCPPRIHLTPFMWYFQPPTPPFFCFHVLC